MINQERVVKSEMTLNVFLTKQKRLENYFGFLF